MSERNLVPQRRWKVWTWTAYGGLLVVLTGLVLVVWLPIGLADRGLQHVDRWICNQFHRVELHRRYHGGMSVEEIVREEIRRRG